MVDIVKLKILLGIEDTDTTQDELLKILKENAIARVTAYLRRMTLPLELEWIADEITVKRYNRIANEGMVNETLSHRNVTFESDVLLEYKEFLDDWMIMNPDLGGGGSNKLVML